MSSEKGPEKFSGRFEIADFLASVLVKTLEQAHEAQKLSQEERKKTRELDHAAFRDPLTDLYNRRALEEFYERLRAEAPQSVGPHRRAHEMNVPSTLIVLDLDNFKGINDTRGHQMGDEILKRTAENMKQRARATDYVGRWGGEEFVIILPRADETIGAKVAEDIRGRIEQGGDVTASFGVAEISPQDLINSPMRDIVARADVALYEAKDRGRNNVVCYTELIPGPTG